jgi:hypothetical protein
MKISNEGTTQQNIIHGLKIKNKMKKMHAQCNNYGTFASISLLIFVNDVDSAPSHFTAYKHM